MTVGYIDRLELQHEDERPVMGLEGGLHDRRSRQTARVSIELVFFDVAAAHAMVQRLRRVMQDADVGERPRGLPPGGEW